MRKLRVEADDERKETTDLDTTFIEETEQESHPEHERHFLYLENKTRSIKVQVLAIVRP